MKREGLGEPPSLSHVMATVWSRDSRPISLQHSITVIHYTSAEIDFFHLSFFKINKLPYNCHINITNFFSQFHNFPKLMYFSNKIQTDYKWWVIDNHFRIDLPFFLSLLIVDNSVTLELWKTVFIDFFILNS